MSNQNKFDEAFLDWFSGCYRTNAASMPPGQRQSLEMAFYAGGIAGSKIGRDSPETVIVAVQTHLRRLNLQP